MPERLSRWRFLLASFNAKLKIRPLFCGFNFPLKHISHLFHIVLLDNIYKWQLMHLRLTFWGWSKKKELMRDSSDACAGFWFVEFGPNCSDWSLRWHVMAQTSNSSLLRGQTGVSMAGQTWGLRFLNSLHADVHLPAPVTPPLHLSDPCLNLGSQIHHLYTG